MMGIKRIYKYTTPVKSSFSLELPQGAKILTVQEQRDKLQIWALVDPKNPTEERMFYMVGTGHPIDEDKETIDYIGTFQLSGGNFIGHLFEIRKGRGSGNEMRNKPKEVEKVLREFWRSESPNGAYHACAIPTNTNQKWVDPTHHKMTVEEARDKIVAIFDTEKEKEGNDAKQNT